MVHIEADQLSAEFQVLPQEHRDARGRAFDIRYRFRNVVQLNGLRHVRDSRLEWAAALD